jgi:hypothetical protein
VFFSRVEVEMGRSLGLVGGLRVSGYD